MSEISFHKNNAFIKIQYMDCKEIIYLYSNDDGINFLKKQLNQSYFGKIVTPDKLLESALDPIFSHAMINDNAGLNNYKWYIRNILSYNKDDKRTLNLDTLVYVSNHLFGQNNFHMVTINLEKENEPKEINKKLIQYLESKRLNDYLHHHLDEKQSQPKIKI